MPRPSNWAILHRTLVRQAGPQSIPRPHPCPDLNGSRVVMLLGHLCPTSYTSMAFRCHEGAAVTCILCPTRCGVPWPQLIYSVNTKVLKSTSPNIHTPSMHLGPMNSWTYTLRLTSFCLTNGQRYNVKLSILARIRRARLL